MFSCGFASTLACSSRVPGTGGPTLDGGTDTVGDASAITTDGTDTTQPVDTTETSDTDTTSDQTDTSGETDTTDTSAGTTSDDTDTTEPDPTGTDATDTATTDETTDTDTTDDPSGTGDPDAGPGDGAIPPPDNMIVVSSFDATDPTGFIDGSTTDAFGALTVARANSIGTLVAPFSQGGQEAAWSFNSAGDYCGYELVARVRLVSGFNESASAAGGVQLRAWSDGWNNFVGNYAVLSGVGSSSELGEWVEYSLDLDEEAQALNAGFDASELNSVGISFISGTNSAAVFTEATFELDWIGLLPKDEGCADGVPDAGPDATDDLTDVTETDGGGDTTSVDTTDEGVPDVIVVSEFDAIDGFAGYTNITDHTPSVTLGDSLGELEVPFTGGNYQQSSWNFSYTAPADGLCGYNLVARVRLDSGFNATGAATGGVQLRAWSDDVWSGNLQNWTNLDAATDTGVWIEYTLDLDAEGEEGTTFDPATLHAVGIAFISGGEAGAEYTTATFSIDWVRFEEKVAGEGGCFSDEPDAGADSGTDDGGVPGDLDGGVDEIDSSVDEDGGVVDEDSGLIDEDSGIIDEGDAGVDSNEDSGVEDNGATEPPLNAVAVLTNFETPGSKPAALGPGYAPEQGESTLVDASDYVIADSVATFTTPFTTTGQAYGASFGTGGIDVTGHELQVRFRIVSEPFVDDMALQLTTWTSDGVGNDYNFNNLYTTIPALGYSDWTVYTSDLDVDAIYPGSLTMAGFQLNSGYGPGPQTTVVFEVDWVAIVPKP